MVLFTLHDFFQQVERREKGTRRGVGCKNAGHVYKGKKIYNDVGIMYHLMRILVDF